MSLDGIIKLGVLMFLLLRLYLIYECIKLYIIDMLYISNLNKFVFDIGSIWEECVRDCIV